MKLSRGGLQRKVWICLWALHVPLLSLAAAADNPFELFQRKAIDEVNQQNESGETPLILAVYNQVLQKVQDLLERGADPLIARKDGKNAIDLAMGGQSQEIKSLLLNTCREKQFGDTYLISILANAEMGLAEKIERMKAMFRAGANPWIRNNEGVTAFEAPCKYLSPNSPFQAPLLAELHRFVMSLNAEALALAMAEAASFNELERQRAEERAAEEREQLP